jgi:hypothetical protein
MRPVPLAAAAALALVAAGCGDTTLDNKDSEGLITKPGAITGVTVTSASCPSDVKVEAGKTFDCDAETDGGKHKVTMKIESVDGDTAHVAIVGVEKAG